MSPVSARVERWKSAWESRDPARVVGEYLPDGAHQSAVIERICPELGRTVLHGHAEIAEYARRGFARFSHLRFEILTVTEQGDRSVVEYRRHSNIDPDKPAYVLELIEWSGDLIKSCRVFHF